MKIIQLGKENYNNVKERALAILREGGVVVVPTDTVYGMAADAGNEIALLKIFQIKGREEEKALPIFISDIKMKIEKKS